MDADELIAERFHHLDDAAQAILGCAAALGYRPDLGLLAECANRPMRVVADALEQARRLDIIVRESSRPRAYRFRHALVQDAICRVRGPESTRSAHALIAAALEKTADRSDHLESLAYHWSAAGDGVRSRVYAELAAQEARRFGV